MLIFLFLESMQAGGAGWGVEGAGERETSAGPMPSREPDVGLDLTTLR